MGKIRNKMVLITVIIIIITVISIGIPGYYTTVMQSNMILSTQMDQRTASLIGVIEGYRDLSQTEEQAQERFIEYLSNRVIGKTGYGFMLTGNGEFMMHPDNNLLGKDGTKYDFVQEILSHKEDVNNNGYGRARVLKVSYNWEGKERFAYYTYHYDWDVFIALSGVYDEFLAAQKTALRNLCIVGVLVLFISISIIYIVMTKMIKPIGLLSMAMKEIEKGNINITPITVKNRDEIGILSKGFNEMTNTLKKLIINIKNSTKILYNTICDTKEGMDQTIQSSQEVTKAINEIALSNQNLAENIEKGNIAIQDIFKSITHTNKATSNINKIIDEVKIAVEKGNIAIKDLTIKSDKTMETFYYIDKQINFLKNKSKEIYTITKIINSISEQTNLLSLNATIESAKVGKLGKGFAVVADEIRKLSMQSEEQTKIINNVINNIFVQIEDIVKYMENGKNTVKEQDETVKKTNRALSEIKIKIKDMENHITIILEQILEITKNTKSTVKIVEDISNNSEETCARSEEVSALTQEQLESIRIIEKSIEKLNDLSKNLSFIVNQFNL
ncbi:methyl-accepting chemotaxis protein [Defluviitalea phaphyphila]|uniref:methyl-accepting chemotaxis protein n=1 Tax=Defluviitalea phaphyphila TaxID=1473580 RepID=UPI00072FEB84|nr:methyl-accepting chemotaxis protein [Defluviitalea phaphyphila]